MYTTRHTIVASSGVYSGTVLSKSPKKAHRLATSLAWDRMMEGDRKHRTCSGIAVEDTLFFRDGTIIGRDLRM